MNELKLYLERLSKKIARSDNEDFCVIDASGSNFDDAYEIGIDDGKIFFARELLGKYFQ